MESHLTAPWSQPVQEDLDPHDVQKSTDYIAELPGHFPGQCYELPDVEHLNVPEMADTSLNRLADGESDISTPPEPQGPINGAMVESVETTVDAAAQKPGNQTTNIEAEKSHDRAKKSLLPAPKDLKTSAEESPKPKPRSGSDIVIAVFGLTGTGKSTFISNLTGKEIKIGHGLKSCTSEIEEVQYKIGLHNVTLLDTPGFDDTSLTDTQILQLIASWMVHAYKKKAQLTGVIYLHRISDPRMSGSSLKNLNLLRSLCGTKNLTHVTLATTMWEKVTEKEGTDRETELLSEGKFWGDLKAKGAMVRRYNNTQGGAIALVNELVQLSPVVLKIQDEVAIQKKALIDTDAGQSINATLNRLSQKHEEELAEIREEMANAIKESNVRWQKKLEEDQRQLRQKIEEVEMSKRVLRAPVNRRAWYRLDWKCKGCKARLTVDRSRDKSNTGTCPGCGLKQTFL